MEDTVRYPIGKFKAPEAYTSDYLAERIQEIAQFPEQLKNEVIHLTDEQLDTPYRDGGWTIRQVAHHCADSHGQALFRFKHALTEENPSIKAYDEGAWAQLPDYQLPAADALETIRLVHSRWVLLLHHMTPADFSRTYYHPEKHRTQPLAEVTLMYAWHGEHHLAHISGLIDRNFDL